MFKVDTGCYNEIFYYLEREIHIYILRKKLYYKEFNLYIQEGTMPSLKSLVLIFGLFFISQTLSSIIDIFEATNGHEPRVALKCGKVPFYIDLETGAWESDSSGVAACDKNKEEVKRFVLFQYNFVSGFSVYFIYSKQC